MRALSALACAAIVLTVAACSVQPPRPSAEQTWPERLESLRQVTHWEASGKLSIRTDDTLDSAAFTWNQAPGYSEIHLSGPFGSNATRINYTAPWVTVSKGGETRRLQSEGPAGLVSVADKPIPLAALPEWLLGIPSATLPVDHRRVEAGLLRQLRQRGWEIRYTEYQEVGNLVLPHRLEAGRGTLQLKIMVQNWRAEAG